VKFNFKLEVEEREITFEAERIYRSKQTERYRITVIGTTQYLIVQSNRPEIENKKLDKPVIWHKVEGYIDDYRTLRLIYQEIEQSLDEPPATFQGTLNL
jgi:hypothetical protein